MKVYKYLVVVPTIGGFYVVGAYGSALKDMAEARWARTADSIIHGCVTDIGAGATIKKLPKMSATA